ncbi:MAG: hypothetical protein UU88_C0008G0018 [Parcubacteria group bacterium GW2011_GWC1_42_11]|nr:MAG: hypothetical protein UU88_C0008G0018 [Parcubacteria group bacterium GW2011_GWC1_42_11]KKT09814.1 MAG: hypothetical protein UV86_C0002G0057 [Candidatus Nomurabacteria bacterium GW2011_GWB1_43_20]
MKHLVEKQIDNEATGGFSGTRSTDTPNKEIRLGRTSEDSPGVGAFTAEMIDSERAFAKREGTEKWDSSKFEDRDEAEIKRRIYNLKERRPLPQKEKEELEELYFELGKIKESRGKRRAKPELSTEQRDLLRETIGQVNATREEHASLRSSGDIMSLNDKLANNIDKLKNITSELGGVDGSEMRDAKKLLDSLRVEKRNLEDLATGYKPSGSLTREQFLVQKLVEATQSRGDAHSNEIKKVAPSIFELDIANKTMQEDMDRLSVQDKAGSAILNETPFEEKNMKQELPPLEFTHTDEQPKEKESFSPIELREKEIIERQKEIANKTDIASIEEKVELEKELSSIAKRLEENASEAIISHGKQGSDVAKIILEERVRIIEGGEEPVAKFINADEGTAEPVGMPTNSSEAITKMESKAISIIDKLDKKVEARAEKIGALDKVRAVGKKWNSLPRHYKLLFTAGLVLSGTGAAIVGSAVAGGAVATLAAGSRALAGAGLFASFEELMRRSHERKIGEPITEATAARQAVLAGTLAILMVSMLPAAMHNVLEGTGATEVLASAKITGATEPTGEKHLSPILPDELLNNALSSENKGLSEIAQAMQTGDVEAVRLTEETLGITHEEALRLIDERKIVTQLETPASANLSDQASYIETAKAGDSVWKMSSEQLKAHYGEKFTGLPEDQQTRIIDAIKDRIVKHPELIGLEDADKLAVGQSVDFGGILNDMEFMDAQFSDVEQVATQEDLHDTTTSATIEQPKQGEWLNQFNARLAERMTADEAQAFGNEIGKALAVNDMEKVFEIEGKMGITHDEFLRLVEETKKIEGAPKVNIPEAPIQDVLISEAETVTAEVGKLLQEPNTEPQVSTPKDPQVLAFADKQVHEHVNSMFGTRGFLGFGSETGIDSAHWKHPQVGFSTKTVGEIMTAEPKVLYEDGSKHFGIEDSSATEKMRDYLKALFKETGLQPKQGITVENYIKDAEAIKIGKLMNKA